ncbi:MAG: hypothetical protein ACO3BE_09760, partial [Gemmobacter sp.]
MLAAEHAEPCVMERPPRRPGKRLLGKLVLVLAAGYVAEWLVGRALVAPRRRIESDPADSLLQRLL